jgi:hypothetical protein
LWSCMSWPFLSKVRPWPWPRLDLGLGLEVTALVIDLGLESLGLALGLGLEDPGLGIRILASTTSLFRTTKAPMCLSSGVSTLGPGI